MPVPSGGMGGDVVMMLGALVILVLMGTGYGLFLFFRTWQTQARSEARNRYDGAWERLT